MTPLPENVGLFAVCVFSVHCLTVSGSQTKSAIWVKVDNMAANQTALPAGVTSKSDKGCARACWPDDGCENFCYDVTSETCYVGQIEMTSASALSSFPCYEIYSKLLGCL